MENEMYNKTCSSLNSSFKRNNLPPLQQIDRRHSIHAEKKSVSFCSSSNDFSQKILTASDCLQYMRKGSEMIKWRSSRRQNKKTFYLNEQMNCIQWTSIGKRQSNSKIFIDEIHDVQLGCSTKTTHSLGRQRQHSVTPLCKTQSFLTSFGKENANSLSHGNTKHHSGFQNWHTLSGTETNLSSCNLADSSTHLNLNSSAFTICYGFDFQLMEILASSPDEANIWVTGLKCLMAGATDPQMLKERQKPRDKWLQSVFEEADSSNQGYLTEFEVIRLIRSINANLSPTFLRQKLKENESKMRNHRGHINKNEFVTFFKKVATRPEIYYVLIRYASGAERMTVEDLQNFFESEQNITGLTLEQCKTIINRYEPSHENRLLDCMGIDGFTALLLSEECDIFNPKHLQVCQDMSHPITHYYIASSHKTFLLEDQLTGPCSIEGYQRALLSGSRYIELEVYDGHDGHPVVKRSSSKPPGIPLQAVLNTIHDFAFMRSEYPVIISIECYASPTQQAVLVNFLRCCLGRRLLLPNSDFKFNLSEYQIEMEDQIERTRNAQQNHNLTTVNINDESTIYNSDGMYVRWPSPRDLVGRILLNGKRINKNRMMNDKILHNGVVANSKKPYICTPNNPVSLYPTTVIKELSDMFFLDCCNYENCSLNEGIKSLLCPTPFNKQLSPLKLYQTNNPNSKSNVVVVGGAQNCTQRPTSQKTAILSSSRFKYRNSVEHKELIVNQEKIRPYSYYIFAMSEADASKAMGFEADELVQVTRNTMLCVSPSFSRADSSNLNPMDIWAWGGQIVPLNYQTAGLVMDLATGFFARNGACGYVLKPKLYCHMSSFFNPLKYQKLNANTLENLPDTTPQILRLKIMSAQQLPKPRGSVSKGDTIEPYIGVELHGIPADCAEQRTSTAAAGNALGYNAMFDETFEFHVQLGSLALVRFVVLDDHAIGDNFIGQNTIPFDCLLSGFRHIRLRSDTGEPIPLATIFIHVTIINKTDNSEQVGQISILDKWRFRNKQHLQLKKIGVPSFDEIFKSASSVLRQAVELRTCALKNFDNFRHLCGEASTPLSMSHCIRAFSNRLSVAFGAPDNWPVRVRIRIEDEMPHMELQNSYFSLESTLNTFPSLSTLGDTTSRSSLLRFSQSSSFHRSPSLIFSPKLFLNKRLKNSAKSIDEDASSTLSIDFYGSMSTKENASFGSSVLRRPSCHSSSSSISSFSTSRIDKMKKTISEFESLIDSCKTIIKQGPYIRVKLQQTQRTALDAYTTFLDGLKDSPTTDSTTESAFLGSKLNSLCDSLTLNQKTKCEPVANKLVSSYASLPISKTSKTSNIVNSNNKLVGTTIYWKRMSRVADNVTWNIRLLTGQIELLSTMHNEINSWIKQTKESSIATGMMLLTTNKQDKTNKLNSANLLSSSNCLNLNQINEIKNSQSSLDTSITTNNNQSSGQLCSQTDNASIPLYPTTDNMFLSNSYKRSLGPLLENYAVKNKNASYDKEINSLFKVNTSRSELFQKNKPKNLTKTLQSDGPITLSTYIDYKNNSANSKLNKEDNNSNDNKNGQCSNNNNNKYS